MKWTALSKALPSGSLRCQRLPRAFSPSTPDPPGLPLRLAHLGRRPGQGVGLPGAGLAEGEDGAGEAAGSRDVAGPRRRAGVRGGVRAVRGCKASPGPHSPAQRQLRKTPHTASPEHVLLRARPVQHGAEAECYIGTPARGAHLGEGRWRRGETPGRAGPGQSCLRGGARHPSGRFFRGGGFSHLQSPGTRAVQRALFPSTQLGSAHGTHPVVRR